MGDYNFMNRRLRRKVRVGVHSAAEEKSKFGKITLFVLVILTAVVILTVVWGNYLKRKAAEIGDGDINNSSIAASNITASIIADNSAHTLPKSSYSAASVPVINAKYITLSSYQDINWGDRAASYKLNGISAVSLVLYYGGGTLNFSSKTAQAMGFQASSTTKTNLHEAIGVLDVAGIYTSGCFYVNYTTKSTPELISVYRTYEAALISEAVDAGFSDILLFGYGTNESAAIEASLLISEVHELKKDAVLGVAIPYKAVESSSADKIFADFAASAKFLAIDFSGVKDEAALLGEIDNVKSYIKKYNLRIVLPDSLSASAGKLDEAGYKNWQIVP
jgi:hypothetical protein